MKIFFHCLLCILFLLFNLNLVVAQSGAVCFNKDILDPVDELSGRCWQGVNYQPWKPEQTPIKRVGIMFHVLHEDDGSGNITDAQILTTIDEVNERMSNLQAANPPFTPPDAIVDSRIRYVVVGIQHHNNSSHYLFPGNSDVTFKPYLENTLFPIYVTQNSSLTSYQKDSLLHFFLGRTDPLVYNDLAGQGLNWVYSVNSDLHFGAHYFTGHWSHELGHCLGLLHVFNDELNTTPNDGCNDTPHFPAAGFSNNMMDSQNTDASSSYRTLSPCQLGNMHYYLTGVGSTFISQTVLHSDYYVFQPDSIITITQDTEWNGSKWLKGNVVVKYPATLTVRCKLHIPQGAKIIVERGATLKVEGGHITNLAPGQMWEGIEVWGNKNEPQDNITTNYGQGQVIISEDAIIENARVGILGLKTTPIDFNFTGGIVNVADTKFLNNGFDVVLLDYPYPVSSTFTKCTFTNTARLKNPTFFSINNPDRRHVFLRECNGTLFTDCRFIDVEIADGYNNYVNAGTGIYTQDAAIQCNVSYFYNLNYGVHSQNFSGSSFFETTEIKYNRFNRVFRNITLTGLGSSYKVYENEINSQSGYEANGLAFWGIVVNGTQVVGVSKNIIRNCFYGVGFQDLTQFGHLNNGLSFATFNDIQHCDVGLATNTTNPKIAVKLYFDCNRFENIKQHSWAKSGNFMTINSPNFTYQQGNYFVNTLPFAFDITNESGPALIYNRRLAQPPNDNPNNRPCVEEYLEPAPNKPYANSITVAVPNKCLVCISSLPTTCERVKCKKPTDGPNGGGKGNGNGGGLPPGFNTWDPATKDAYYMATDSATTMLPPAETVLLKAKWGQLKKQEREGVTGLYMNYLHENDQYASSTPFLESLQDTFAKWILLSHYVKSRQYGQAQTLLPQLTPTNVEETNRKLHFQTLVNIALSGRNVKQLNPSEVAVFEQIGLTCTQVAHSARNALYAFDGRTVAHNCPTLFDDVPQPNGSLMRYGKSPDETTQSLTNDFEAYPNPTTGQMTIRWTAPTAARYTLTDAVGRTVWSATTDAQTETTVDFSAFPAGVYTLTAQTAKEQKHKRIALVK